MVFKCQEDSFLKQYSSIVKGCKPCEFKTLSGSIETCMHGFEVILEETILFPEGGGQPSDHGFINDSQVYEVKRKGSTAIHFVDKPLDVGANVEIKIDWERRFDHMQQHSGQHLITAFIERKYNYPTVSWWLGEQVSHIELDTPQFTTDQIKTAESLINDLIASRKEVTVEVFNSANDMNGVRARGLPDDHEGDVRVVTIDGIDSNMCCGTHVTNLSQLQIVKLLGTEKSKRKNKTLLYFLVGNRVLKRLSTCLIREQQLTALLKCTPADHPDMVEKLQKNLKITSKDLQNVLKDVVVYEAQKCKSMLPPPKYYVLHRKEADSDFMNLFIKEVGSLDIFLFLSVGDDRGPGSIVLYGNADAIAKLGNKIITLLDGKGIGKGNKFQGKVNRMENRPQVEELLKEYFK